MRIEGRAVEVPLAKRFQISVGVSEYYRGVYVRALQGESAGWGEAVPSKRVTGETVEDVVSTVSSLARDMEDMMPSEARAHLKGLNLNGAAVAALDMALWDLELKLAGTSIKEAFPLRGDRMPTSITVSSGCLSETPLEIRNAIEDYGAKEIKLKLSGDLERDIARVRATRAHFGDSINIRADANTIYDYDRAEKLLNAIHRYDPEFVEQPLPVGQERDMAMLEKKTGVPVMADESAMSPDDIPRLADAGITHINIKLMKCGGITAALEMASLAEENGMVCQVGCMVESEVALTAGLIVALSSRSVKYADLDGITFMAPRPYIKGGCTIEEGDIVLNTIGNGLGYDLDWDNLP